MRVSAGGVNAEHLEAVLQRQEGAQVALPWPHVYHLEFSTYFYNVSFLYNYSKINFNKNMYISLYISNDYMNKLALLYLFHSTMLGQTSHHLRHALDFMGFLWVHKLIWLQFICYKEKSRLKNVAWAPPKNLHHLSWTFWFCILRKKPYRFLHTPTRCLSGSAAAHPCSHTLQGQEGIGPWPPLAAHGCQPAGLNECKTQMWSWNALLKRKNTKWY